METDDERGAEEEAALGTAVGHVLQASISLCRAAELSEGDDYMEVAIRLRDIASSLLPGFEFQLDDGGAVVLDFNSRRRLN